MRLQMEYDSFQWRLKFWNNFYIANKSDSNLCEISLNKSSEI